MSLKVEKLEHNMAKLTIEVPVEEFKAAVQKAYLKERGRISVPGFRKGKASKQLIEKMYGKGVFFEGAANILIPEAYEKELKDTDLDIVSRPEIDVEEMGEDVPFVFTATVALRPEVTLGQYKGVEIEKEEITVTDEEVEKRLERELETNSRLVSVEDRAVQDKDTVNLDFDGSVDGVQFEGGKAEGYSLVIGSHSFIDTFEDQLVGKNIGDEFDVNVTFPQEYHAKELAGKPAVFKVKINGIQYKEVPAADDEFAQEVSEFDTLAEYKESLKKELLEGKEKDAARKKEDKVVKKVVELATMDIPEAMIEEQANQLVRDFEYRIQAQGLSMEQYMQFTGMNAAALVDQMKPQAKERIESSLVLDAIVKAEGITADDEAFEKRVEELASRYQMEKEKLVELLSDREKEQIKNDLAIEAAVNLIVAEAKEV
ncbi:MAG: trigger factor [Eubacteriales bacterium]|nr:trigger factor [Eubacteriales bacterium]